MKKSSILSGVLSLVLIIITIFATIQFFNVLSLQSDVMSLENEISQLDQASVDRDTIITWLDTAYHLAESRTNLKLPNASKYLTLPDQNNEEKTTKIFLVSTAAGYHYFPTTEFTTDLFKPKFSSNWSRGTLELTQNRSISLSRWGWTFDAGGLSAGSYEYQIGSYAYNPVLIIGVTIRSDYSSIDFDEAVGNRTGKYVSSINLDMRLYSQNGSLIEYSSIKNAWTSSKTAVGGVSFLLEAGQSKQVIFYVTTSSLDIDHYEIYVSSLTPY